jgi:hypothetical protein
MMDPAYIETVRLLLEAAPAVFAQPNFAMKGGTAINLFAGNMARLSVDIDVVYVEFRQNRREALDAISASLQNIGETLRSRGLEVSAVPIATGDDMKLIVRRGAALVKIEVNHVFRGTVLPVVAGRLEAEARHLFARELAVPILHPAELYGSKLVAALDRQHPRDFFDVAGLYEKEGLRQETVECFVCYLAGHNRPVHEVLFSRDQNMAPAFENEFFGMTRERVTLERLEEMRRRLRDDLPAALTAKHRAFLLGLVKGEPDWSLMECRHLAELPALRWKLENLRRLKKSNAGKFSLQESELQKHWKD